MNHEREYRIMKRFSASLIRLFILLMLLLCILTPVCAENGLPEVQLDLAGTTGHILIDKLWEIRYAPDTWNGIVLRVRGQYYAEETEEGIRRSLIVTDCLDHCSEIAFQLVPADGPELSWPEINREVEIIAQVAVYETAYGNRSRLAVCDVVPLDSGT